MEELTPEMLQLGMVGILFFLAIREFFAYLRNKKNKDGADCGNKEIVQAINNMEKSLGTKLENLGDKIDKVDSGIARLIGRSDKRV